VIKKISSFWLGLFFEKRRTVLRRCDVVVREQEDIPKPRRLFNRNTDSHVCRNPTFSRYV
jgi:hypothetical protein